MEVPILQTTYKVQARFTDLLVVHSFISLSWLRGHKIQFPHPFRIRISFRPSFFIQVSIWKSHFLAKSLILQLRHSVCKVCGLQVNTQPAMQILHRIDDFSDFTESFSIATRSLTFQVSKLHVCFHTDVCIRQYILTTFFPNCGIKLE